MSRPNSQNKWYEYVRELTDPDSTLGEMFANEGIVGGMSDTEEYHELKIMENNEASAYQQQRLDSTSSINVPTMANVIFPMCNRSRRGSLNEHLGIERDVIIGLKALKENVPDELMPFIGHYGLEIMENIQTSANQQQCFDAPSSLNNTIPSTVMYGDTNLGIEKNILIGLETLEENLPDGLMALPEPYELKVIENNQTSASQPQCTDAPSSLNNTIPSNLVLVQRNSDQVVTHTSSLVHPETNNGMHDETSNVNFPMAFTDEQRIGSNENNQQGRHNLDHGSTSNQSYQMGHFESTQSSYQYRHIDFSFESNRFISFLSIFSLANTYVSAEKLARYGFYYNSVSDHVKCCFCGVVIGDWSIGEDPLIEHFKHSPDCNFLNLTCTTNVPNDEALLKNELEELFNRMRLNPVSVPRHPYYKDANTRLQSYAKWPKALPVTKEELSQAGFFYLNTGDQVKCFHCGRCLHDWKIGDSPLKEHMRLLGDTCQFIQNNYSMLKRNARQNKNKGNTTRIQIDRMKEYMAEHPNLKEGRLDLKNKALYNQLWDELTKILNVLTGPKKTTVQWKQVYKDSKSNDKKRTNPLQTSQPKLTMEPVIVQPQSVFPTIIIDGQQIGFQLMHASEARTTMSNTNE